jgi:hypothetical protein
VIEKDSQVGAPVSRITRVKELTLAFALPFTHCFTTGQKLGQMIQRFTSAKVLAIFIAFLAGGSKTIATGSTLDAILQTAYGLRSRGRRSGGSGLRICRSLRGVVRHAVDDGFGETLHSVDGLFRFNHLFTDSRVGHCQGHCVGRCQSSANGDV